MVWNLGHGGSSRPRGASEFAVSVLKGKEPQEGGPAGGSHQGGGWGHPIQRPFLCVCLSLSSGQAPSPHCVASALTSCSYRGPRPQHTGGHPAGGRLHRLHPPCWGCTTGRHHPGRADRGGLGGPGRGGRGGFRYRHSGSLGAVCQQGEHSELWTAGPCLPTASWPSWDKGSLLLGHEPGYSLSPSGSSSHPGCAARPGCGPDSCFAHPVYAASAEGRLLHKAVAAESGRSGPASLCAVLSGKAPLRLLISFPIRHSQKLLYLFLLCNALSHVGKSAP